MNWISVDDFLPETFGDMSYAESAYVAVKVKGFKGWQKGKYMELPQINTGQWSVGSISGDILVTHWLAVDEPPE